MSDTLQDLKQQLLKYKVGEKIGPEMFQDADRGELDNFQVHIAVFGMTGSGKSALINTVHRILYGADTEPAVVQSSGGEGTVILEEFFNDLGFKLIDTRGFFEFDTTVEETELFRILYGGVRAGENIDRGTRGERKAASAGVAGHKLNKAPLSRQAHVVLWVIKADDVRLTNDMYRDKFKFVQERLNAESISIVTVITHGDVVDGSDARRAEVTEKARKATGSFEDHTFLISNWLSEQSGYDVGIQMKVLQMMNTALECAERSVKMRQSKRSMGRRRAAVRAEDMRRRGVNVPREDDDEYWNNDINSNVNMF